MTLNKEEKNAVKAYRLQKASETYEEAEFNYSGGHYTLAINRLYYSLFYAIVALLVAKNINASSHTGVRSMMHLHLGKTGLLTREELSLYNNLFMMRNSGDYDDFFDYTKEEVEPLLLPVRGLLAKIRELAEREI